MITIENLRHFLAVVDHHGVNRAAEHLFISSSSLTRSIQMIETDKKVSLFNRVGRTLSLTREGEALFQEAREVVSKFDALLSEHTLKGPDLSGHYLIGASHFLTKYLLPEKLNRISQQFKNATFGIYSFDSSILIKKIHLGEIDFGISFGLKTENVVESELLSSGQLYLCTRKDHPLAQMSFAEVKKKISSYPAVMHRPVDSFDRCDNHPVYKEHGIKPNIQLYWDSDFFALDVLAKSDSWSLMPQVVIDSDPRVVKLAHPKNWDAPYEIKLLWNSRKSNEVLKKAFLEE